MNELEELFRGLEGAGLIDHTKIVWPQWRLGFYVSEKGVCWRCESIFLFPLNKLGYVKEKQ